MKEVELRPGWLKRQMEKSIAEVASWPPIFQALGTINDGLKQKEHPIKETEVNEPTELEMAQTRHRLQEFPEAYLEAIASHHSRVAQVALDMRKAIEASRYSSAPPIDHMEQMARIVENSFARSFGVKLRAAPMAESNEANNGQ